MSKFHENNIHPTEIALKVMDLEKAERFYREIMGFKLLEKNHKQVVLSADGEKPIISLSQPDHVIDKQRRRTGIYHFAILLPDIHQLGLFLKHIRNLSYPIRGGSNHGVSQAVYLEDLDNIGIEVYADRDIELWERRDGNIEMVTLPLDYEKIIKDTGDMEWEGMPEDTIIGHIHLHVSDLEEAKTFYLDGLGFDLISEMGGSAVFTSTNGYHHHIAFNIWNGKGAKAPDKNSVGMKYYVIEFPNKKLLDEKIARLKLLGYESFEEEASLFIKDPSQNLISLTLSTA